MIHSLAHETLYDEEDVVKDTEQVDFSGNQLDDGNVDLQEDL